ncbi:PREDICTED: F-box/LRR-repeat protein 2-like [Camelina sativa]|uniref:F-box/LRR-repeat protein 2-like n=1 Tax=Camelina sativa TaxID=90675 RepID=A0ABM0TQZ3_CAMSA|nr:PREDICTED: F-box/LRR-repeat protein 2-like [Camelina sativa]
MDIHLPEECWELICKAMEEDDYRFLESVSVVSTLLLSITNRVRSTFVITDRTLPSLDRHLLRFRNLKRIKFFDFNHDLNSTLLQVSRSGLDLESVDVSQMRCFPDFESKSMTMMKELKCSGVGGFQDSNLVSIGASFPFLEKLDISYPNSIPSKVSDSGVISLSSNLKGLLKINISGNSFITDKSLIALSRNCLLLREIIFRDCDFISSESIKFLLHNSKNLESLAINGIGLRPRESLPSDAFRFARRLIDLDLSDSFLFDELLCFVADAKLPLKKLLLSNCQGFTFDGVCYLLSKYQTLLHLNLNGANFLSDDMIMKLALFFPRLTFVNISFCSKLTGLSFFTVIERCVSLRCMIMEGTNFGLEDYDDDKELDDVKSRIKFLYLSRNHNLRDECLEKISRYCPFIESLDVAQCPGITRDGILHVWRNCGDLRSLDISRCTGIRSLGVVVDFELPKLESLRACGTWIDDQALDMISKRCRGLLHLDLQGCLNVSSKGVREVVQRCIRLREINLKYCEADDGIFTWMVFANPSLRKIVPPCGFSPTEKLQNFLLRHGCVISHDSSELLSLEYRANGRDDDTLTRLII